MSGCVALPDRLPHMRYPIDAVESGMAQLNYGFYAENPDESSATRTEVRMGRWAEGDLNGSVRKDAALILESTGGGSGRFSYLAVVIDGRSPIPALFLGDRIKIKGIEISTDGIITVHWLGRGENEAMASEPTIPIQKSYVYHNESLLEVATPSLN